MLAGVPLARGPQAQRARSPRDRARRALPGLAALLALIAAGASAAQAASVHATPEAGSPAQAIPLSPRREPPPPTRADRRATGSYLAALATYQRVRLRLTAAAYARAKAYAERLGEECGPVLRDLPLPAQLELGAEDEERRLTPAQRLVGQITGELLVGVFVAWEAPYRASARAFARSAGHLRWSDARLTRLTRKQARLVGRTLAAEPPDVCADMRAWAASGYTAVDAATHELLSAFTPWLVSNEVPDYLLELRLRSREGPVQRAFAKRLNRQWSRYVGHSLDGVFAAWAIAIKQLGGRLEAHEEAALRKYEAHAPGADAQR